METEAGADSLGSLSAVILKFKSASELPGEFVKADFRASFQTS